MTNQWQPCLCVKITTTSITEEWIEGERERERERVVVQRRGWMIGDIGRQRREGREGGRL